MFLKKKLFQEKFITLHKNNGSVEILLISLSIVAFLVIPTFMFITDSLILKSMTNQTKENLDISFINAYAAIDEGLLGSGQMRFDKEMVKENIENNFALFSGKFSQFIEDDTLEICINDFENTYVFEGEIYVKSLFFNTRVLVHSQSSYLKDPLMGE